MSFRSLTAGDTTLFGRYPQGGAGEVLPVSWQVLDTAAGRALLLSRDILDAQPFSEDGGSLFWGDSHLRAWLESDFLPRAFTLEEAGQIAWPDHPGYADTDRLLWQLLGMDDATENIRDTVFTLSHADVLRYFPGGVPLFCPGASAQPTAWAAARGAGDPCWWLRSSSAQGFAYIVSPVDSVGACLSPRALQGVRPALWLRTDG